MTILNAWVVPVVRLRESERQLDQYGDPIAGSGSTASTPLPDGLFAPGTTSEPVAAGAAPVISQPAVYWNGMHPDVLPTDVLVINGTQYAVEGKPSVWPLGLVVTLKAVEEKTWQA